jgi:hypothetical protein
MVWAIAEEVAPIVSTDAHSAPASAREIEFMVKFHIELE